MLLSLASFTQKINEKYYCFTLLIIRKLEHYFRGSDSTNDFLCLGSTIKIRLFYLFCAIPYISPLYQDNGNIHFYIQCSILRIFLFTFHVFNQELTTL